MCLPSTLIGCCAREVGKSISLASVLESGTVKLLPAKKIGLDQFISQEFSFAKLGIASGRVAG